MEKTKVKEMEWYMIKCVTGKEQKAIENLKHELEFNKLDNYVEDMICPKEKQYFMRKEKKISREKVMFPGYFLIKMKLTGEIPRVIKNTNLVAEIMGNHKGAEPLKKHEVERIFGNIEKSNESMEYFVGENVKIIDGPFKGFNAVIKELNKSKDRIKVEVMVFGSPTPVELKYLQIDKMVR